MADKYKIEPRSLHALINEGDYKLPRYQRKDTWNEKQYFELCLSVFQGYPIGSVIINNDGQNLWLLDGRQRRTCIKKLYENPIQVYNWAKKVCKIKSNFQDSQVSEQFWKKVEDFLGRDLEEEYTKEENNDDSEVEELDEQQTSTETVESEEARNASSLVDLYKYIMLGHKKLLTAFDFGKFISEKALGYYVKKSNGDFACQPEKLSKFIRDINKDEKDNKGITKDSDKFLNYIESKFDFKEDKKSILKFKTHLLHYWDIMQSAFETYNKVDFVLTNSKVGVIELANAGISDAQNIFSKINSGGTQLSAAELLSAKPYWNKIVDPSPHVRNVIKVLYEKLKTDGSVDQFCRWDIPATILSCVDSRHLFFKTVNSDPNVTEVDVNEIAMGFKLVSSCMVGGMSKISLDLLEKDRDAIDWSDSLSSFSESIKSMIDTIYNSSGLSVLCAWNTCIYDLLGAGATMELIAGAYTKWKNGISEKSHSSSEFKSFISGIKNHFDRLVLDKVSGAYKGSGDSKMASNLKQLDKRTAPISSEENQRWSQLIDGAIIGSINGKDFKHEAMKPLLYYEKVIKQYIPLTGDTAQCFDIDHIYPQAIFDSSSILQDYKQDSICNLALLPNDINKMKSNRILGHSNFSAICRQSIAHYEKIESDEFDKFSRPENFEILIEIMSDRIRDAFSSERIRYLG